MAMDARGFSDRGDDPFAPGDVVEDRYRVIRKLSAGGVGAVYEVQHVFTGLRVALKALHNQRGDNPERMRAEARTLAEMRHPNIVQITDGGVFGATVWFTMELLEGRTLRQELLQTGALGIPRALRFGLQIAEGVAAAHAAGVIHRDLKPENIFVVTPGDKIKILDFGTSKITSKQRRSAMLKTTDRFRLIGTQAYMPPERLRAGLADARADVYALGHMLYEMIAGRHCWSEGPGPLDLPPMHELGLRQIYTSPRSIREHAPDVPDWIDQLVLTALAKDPDHRQQTMQAMVEELRAAIARYERERPCGTGDALPRAIGAGRGAPLATERMDVPPSGELVTTRESPEVARGIPAPSSESRTRIDALLVCGAARFAAAVPEPDETERGMNVIASVEVAKPAWRGMLRSLAHRATAETERWREAMRDVLGWIGRSEGAEQQRALEHLLAFMTKRGWKAEEDRAVPLPHPALALGAALLLAPDRRSDPAEAALVRLRDLDADVQSLAVSVMVAFARTDPGLHPAPRSALLALLLGGPEDSELAHVELAKFVLSAAAVTDRSPVMAAAAVTGRSPVMAAAAVKDCSPAMAAAAVTDRSPSVAKGAPLPSAAAVARTPTPSGVTTPRRPPEASVHQDRSASRPRANLAWVALGATLVSGTVLLGGLAFRSAARDAGPASAASVPERPTPSAAEPRGPSTSAPEAASVALPPAAPVAAPAAGAHRSPKTSSAKVSAPASASARSANKPTLPASGL